jgi:FkbM family methyltransferase
MRDLLRQLIIRLCHGLGYRVESLKAKRITVENVLDEALTARPTVFFLQVGAHDGRKNDPVFRLRRRPGWSGLMVEANPAVFAVLERNLQPEPNIRPVQRAICPANGTVDFSTVARPEATKCPNWADQISSLSRQYVVDTLVQWGHSATEAESLVSTSPVAASTFETLLREFGVASLDLLVLDLEGMDFELLKLFPFQILRPEWIVFESSHVAAAERATFPSFFAERGYAFIEIGQDTICQRW